MDGQKDKQTEWKKLRQTQQLAMSFSEKWFSETNSNQWLEIKVGLIIIKLLRHAMFPFPEHYVPLDVICPL